MGQPTPSGNAARVLAIIQARTGSARLPGKVLLDLAGQPVLAHVIERIRRSRLTGDFIVATTIKAEDLAIVALCAKLGVRVYCGDALDPLERYHQSARLFGAEHIVRIKADCPAIDPAIVDEAIRRHLQSGADYTGNTIERSYPVGQDVEILTRPTLERLWRQARLMSEREHLTLHIANHPGDFRIAHLKQPTNLSAKRWTIDYPEDYALMRRIFAARYPVDPLFGMQAVLDFLAEHPELERLNAHIPVDAGIRISLANDRPAAAPG